MSRTGVELKPAWQTVPPSVRQAVEGILGAPVRRAMRVWGGYGPTPTYRLRLADGRRAFFKGVNPDSNPFMRAAYGRELRVYRELAGLIAGWAPAFYGAFARDDWSVMLLEDLGRKNVPPWTPRLAAGIAQAFGRFHASTLGIPLPEWLPRPTAQTVGPALLWQGAQDPAWRQSLADLAGARSVEARHWLVESIPTLTTASRRLTETGPPFALIHWDLRSDNLRWVRSRLYLLDWPHAGAGHPEVDAAAFAQSVTVEGGPLPEAVMAWYAEAMPVRSELVDAAVASIAGFFADLAWGQENPELPRLRAFQRRQLKVTLAWAARRLDLPDPTWLDAIPEATQNAR